LIGLRQKQAERLLHETSLSIKEIAQRLGYGAPQFFTREFRKAHGCPPREFRRG
jgi:AraC-like DNA-binding protein